MGGYSLSWPPCSWNWDPAALLLGPSQWREDSWSILLSQYHPYRTNLASGPIHGCESGFTKSSARPLDAGHGPGYIPCPAVIGTQLSQTHPLCWEIDSGEFPTVGCQILDSLLISLQHPAFSAWGRRWQCKSRPRLTKILACSEERLIITTFIVQNQTPILTILLGNLLYRTDSCTVSGAITVLS
jgi:hypothetical protein